MLTFARLNLGLLPLVDNVVAKVEHNERHDSNANKHDLHTVTQLELGLVFGSVNVGRNGPREVSNANLMAIATARLYVPATLLDIHETIAGRAGYSPSAMK